MEYRRLALLVLLALSLPAQTLTTVSGTVRDAAGNAITGTAIISWSSFLDVDSVLVLGGSLSSTITAGSLSVALSPNVGATPSGTSYAVRVFSTDRSFSSTEAWVVPNTTTATIAASRSTTVPVPSASVQVTQIVPGTNGQYITTASGAAAWATAQFLINCDAPIELTIAGGVITLAASACYLVDTEADAASDNLTAISCAVGQRVILQPASGARTVVIVDGANHNIPVNFTMDNEHDRIGLLCTATDVVSELFRTSGGS